MFSHEPVKQLRVLSTLKHLEVAHAVMSWVAVGERRKGRLRGVNSKVFSIFLLFCYEIGCRRGRGDFESVSSLF